MIENSFIFGVLLRLWTAVQNCFPVRILEALFNLFLRWLRGSRVFQFLFMRTGIENYAQSAVFYRMLRKGIHGILYFPQKVYLAIRSFNQGSMNQRFFERFLVSSRIFHMESFLCLAIVLLFVIPHNAWNNMYAFLLALGLMCIYILCLLSENRKIGMNTDKLWFSFLFFVFSTAMSVLGTPTMGDSIRVFVFFITGFLFTVITYGVLNTEKRMDLIFKGMLLSLLVASLLAIFQRITGVESDASLTDLELNKGMPGRVFGTLGNPNNFAEYLVLFLPFIFAWSQNTEKTGAKLLGFLTVMIGTASLLLTYSRAGWLAFCVALIVFVFLYNRRLLPVLVLGGILCIPFLPQTILNRILTIGNLADSSSSYRIDIWTGCLRMLREGHWFSGVGLGADAFQTVYPMFAVGETAVAPHSHMQFLEILIEMGILGLLSILWFSVSMVRRAASCAMRTRSKKLKRILCAAASSVAGISFIGFFEYTWFYPRVQISFFIVAGILMAAVKLAGKEETENEKA